MAGGSLTISVSTYPQLQQVAQSVLCWVSAVNRFGVRTISSYPEPVDPRAGGTVRCRFPGPAPWRHRPGRRLRRRFPCPAYQVSNANVAVGQERQHVPCPDQPADDQLDGHQRRR